MSPTHDTKHINLYSWPLGCDKWEDSLTQFDSTGFLIQAGVYRYGESRLLHFNYEGNAKNANFKMIFIDDSW